MEYSLDDLKLIATKVGCNYHPNISQNSLQVKLEEFLEKNSISLEACYIKYCSSDKEVNNKEQEEPTMEEVSVSKPNIERLKNLTFKEVEVKKEAEAAKERLKEANKLVRVRVTSNDRSHASWNGEMIFAGNAEKPVEGKFVPYGVPWNVPQIILNYMKEKKVQMFKRTKRPDGNEVTQTYEVPAFNIEILSPLTKEELLAIQKKQLAENLDAQLDSEYTSAN